MIPLMRDEQMSKILFASHGSASSDGAARIAQQIAERAGGQLYAVTVLEPLPVVDYGYGMVYARSAEEEESYRTGLRGAVEAQLQRCGVGNCKVNSRSGLVVGEIDAEARDIDADLIVLGTGPHHLIDRVLASETVLQLMQLATVPVLAVPGNLTEMPHRMIAAVDFTATSTRAAEIAAGWSIAGDHLTLVHVRATPVDSGTNELSAVEVIEDRQLADLRERVRTIAHCEIETVELIGDPARMVVQTATQTDSTLIALGTHGYGVWKRLQLGSVASKVIRSATTCVLINPLNAGPCCRPCSSPSLAECGFSRAGWRSAFGSAGSGNADAEPDHGRVA
jgi:nucleotide-binding universal stress UspA family protein